MVDLNHSLVIKFMIIVLSTDVFLTTGVLLTSMEVALEEHVKNVVRLP